MRDYAHRIAYVGRFGPIPPAYTVDHLCHNIDPACAGGPSCVHRACVEPTHMEAVSRGENVMRRKSIEAEKARQTHCIHDHEFTAENTYSRKDGHGKRECRACNRRRQRKPKPQSEPEVAA